MTQGLMPAKLDLGRSAMTAISHPLDNYRKWIEDGRPQRAERMVMGYRLPEWQRGLVWTDTQSVKLIESVWLGLNIGTYSYNRSYDDPTVDDLLLDGQQRLWAIEQYINNVFPVFGHTYDELPRVDKRRFDLGAFHCYITDTQDESYLKSYYDLMNFGGTAHISGEEATI